MYGMETTQQSSTLQSDTAAEDVPLALVPEIGRYVLALVTDGMACRASHWQAEWRECVAGFALYLHDSLPEGFRLPVRPLEQTARVRRIPRTL